jgi:NADH-quinone oxidoreductase subunit L
MGAVGKSSQFPLHIWLPDAMEGPTPVSALMHAATMVAAGVYMCVRLFPIFTPSALIVIAYIGAITAILAALIAVSQNDIKKVLAYSTVSQLGFMILAVGTGVYTAAFFHLLTHAMFKANLFYCSGSVIHSMHHALHKTHDHDTDPQDMRNMGGFKDKMPITYFSMLVSTLAIAGVPLFSGFFVERCNFGGYVIFCSASSRAFSVTSFWLLSCFLDCLLYVSSYFYDFSWQAKYQINN